MYSLIFESAENEMLPMLAAYLLLLAMLSLSSFCLVYYLVLALDQTAKKPFCANFLITAHH